MTIPEFQTLGKIAAATFFDYSEFPIGYYNKKYCNRGIVKVGWRNFHFNATAAELTSCCTIRLFNFTFGARKPDQVVRAETCGGTTWNFQEKNPSFYTMILVFPTLSPIYHRDGVDERRLFSQSIHGLVGYDLNCLLKKFGKQVFLCDPTFLKTIAKTWKLTIFSSSCYVFV